MNALSRVINRCLIAAATMVVATSSVWAAPTFSVTGPSDSVAVGSVVTTEVRVRT